MPRKRAWQIAEHVELLLLILTNLSIQSQGLFFMRSIESCPTTHLP